MAEPARQELPQEAPQEAPKPPSDLNEALTGKETPAPRPNLEELEQGSFESGREAIKQKWESLNLQAEPAAQQFKQETKSWWDRAKGFFKKGEAEPSMAKGEAEIMKEVEKADAVYAAFKAKYEEIMASGDEAGLKSLERSLSGEYDKLAPAVAEEGVKGLKEQPMSVAGAKLNEVNRRLEDVRARLGGATPEQIAKMRAPKAEAPAQPEAARAGAAPAPEASVDDARERAELLRQSKGTKGEKMVDQYLAVAKTMGKTDSYGEVTGTSFDPQKGEIRVRYADGSELRTYESGVPLRVLPGGKVETVEAEAAMNESVVSGEFESKNLEPVEDLEPSVIVAPGAAKMRIITSEESPTAAGEIGGEEPKETTPVAPVEPEGPPEPTPRERYPNLPEPVPGTFPPGVPDSREPKPGPAPEPEPKKEARAKKPKKGYDEVPLTSLKEHLAWRKERLNKPGRFTGKELEDEKKMIAQMEESVARRTASEAPPQAVEAPAQAEPAPEAPPEAPAEPEPEKEDDLSSMEFYEPHFGQIAAAFLKDPKIDPAAVKMVGRKAKGINALDMAKLLVDTGAFEKDAAPSIAQEFLQNPALFEAARAKFVSAVEAALKKKS